MKVFICVFLLTLAACATDGSAIAPDMQNPQRPQAGPPFPYSGNGW